MTGQGKETLAGIEIFRTLKPGDLEALGRRCRWRRYKPEQQIVGYLDEERDVYFIVAGRVRVIVYSVAGKEVTFRDIERGNIFGEFSAIDGQPRSANVVSLTGSLIASMSAEVFRDVLRGYPAVAELTLRRLTRQIRYLSERVFEFSTVAVKYRVHAELLRLARHHMKDDNSAVISPAPTHADIASRVSTHREAVTRELNDMTRSGLIERQRGAIVVPDVDNLGRLVEEVLGHPIEASEGKARREAD